MHGRNRKKYVVLGAGISGLSLAWFLKKNDPDCELLILEQSSKAGGFIQTHNTFGFQFELGPHMLRLNFPYQEVCNELFNDLELTDKLIHPHSSYKTRFLAYNDSLHPVTMNLQTLLNPKNFIKLTYPILKNTFFSCNLRGEDLSVEDFFETHFGKHITHHFIDPLVMGISGGQISSTSFKAHFPNMHKISESSQPFIKEMLRQRKKNKSEFVSFKDGLSTLTQALENKLKDSICYNTEVKQIKFSQTPTVVTALEEIECDQIFSTLSSTNLSQILSEHKIVFPTSLSKQKHLSYKIVHIGYDAKLDLPNAFGYIAPSWSQQKISGAIFDSKLFPEQNFRPHQTRITAMVHENSPLFDLPQPAFEKAFFEELNLLLKIHVAPQYFETHTLNHAIAQYEVGHIDAVDQLNEELQLKLPYLSFCGSSFYGLSVPMCIYYAHKLGHQRQATFS